MLRWLTRAVRRWRTAPDHAAALRSLRRRFAEERALGPHSAEERRLALALAASRERLAAAQGDASACARCAVGAPPPAGRWSGGWCCSGRTEALFDAEAVAALSAAGTRPRHLGRGAGEPAGCLFRGPLGCLLPPRHRPDGCLRHVCPDLHRELFARGALPAVEAARRQNQRLAEAFRAARAARLAREFCDGLVRAASRSARRRPGPAREADR